MKTIFDSPREQAALHAMEVGLEEGYSKDRTSKNTPSVQRGVIRVFSWLFKTFIITGKWHDGLHDFRWRYYDCYFADITGGGQEVADVSFSKGGSVCIVTRVYAGGCVFEVPSQRDLAVRSMDINKMLQFFLRKCRENGKSPRLLQNVKLRFGAFTYDFGVIKVIPEIPLVLSEERILFKKWRIFTQFITLTTVTK